MNPKDVGETPRNDTRAKTGALATGSNWTLNFLIAFFTPFITGDIGYSYGYVFAGCNIFSAIIVYFFLYESSGLSLEVRLSLFASSLSLLSSPSALERSP
jgi:SP family sugar:H+ symporter-like MFS transporter